MLVMIILYNKRLATISVTTGMTKDQNHHVASLGWPHFEASVWGQSGRQTSS